MESKIQKSLIEEANIKNILLAVMTINSLQWVYKWYKLICFDDKFSKYFKRFLGEDAVYNSINSLIEESKYSSDFIKKHFNKELAMTKEDNENFKNST